MRLMCSRASTSKLMRTRLAERFRERYQSLNRGLFGRKQQESRTHCQGSQEECQQSAEERPRPVVQVGLFLKSVSHQFHIVACLSGLVTLGLMQRRKLLAGFAAAAPTLFSAGERVKGAIIGSGGRGQFLTREFKEIGVEMAAVCDVYEGNLKKGLEAASTGARVRAITATEPCQRLVALNTRPSGVMKVPVCRHR